MLRSESLKEEAAKIAVAIMWEYENKFDEIIACCFSAGDKVLCDRVLLDETKSGSLIKSSLNLTTP